MKGFSFGAKYIAQFSRDDTGDDPTRSSEASTSQQVPISAIIPAQLNGEVGQHLQKLTKRDETTRLKALQALKRLIEDRDTGVSEKEDVRLMLGPWAYAFKRCVFDGNRLIRMEACHLMGIVALKTKKDLRSVLKFVYPYWYMAQFDESAEVAAAARNGLKSVFPGSKALEALFFCRLEVLSGFSDNLRATAASLGDPTKDSPEELENRYERVLSMTPLAIGGVLDDVKRADTVEGGRSAAKLEICDRVKALLKDPQFTKVLLKAKSPRVRQSVYGLISHLSREHAVIFSSDIVEGLAPAILSSIGEKDHAIHSSMWGTLLSFTLAFPLAWKTIDIPKAFLPRLWSHIRHISPVSAEVAFSAILPLASVLPSDIVDKLPFFKSLLSSIWDSQANLAQESARIAAARAWQECFLFGTEQKNIDFEELFDVAFEPLVLHGAIVKGEQLARDVTYAVASALVKTKSPCLGAYENGISRAVTQALENSLLCNDQDSLRNVRLLVVRHKSGCQENLELIGGTEVAEKCLALLLNHIFGDGNFINPEELGNENRFNLKVDEMLFAASLYKLIPPEAAHTQGGEGWTTWTRAPLQRDLPMVVSNAKHLVEQLASENQYDAHFTAACDLLISIIASAYVRDASEIFFSAIDQIIKMPNSRRGGAIRLVQSCVSYCAASKKSSLCDWSSAKLDNLCAQLCYSTVAIDSYTEEFITNVVMGDGETTSLLTEEGQEGLLRALLERVNPSKSCDETADTWVGGSDSIIAMRLLLKLVLAPTLAKTSSMVALQVSVLTFLYHMLLEEIVVDKSYSRLVEEGAFSEEEDEEITPDSRGAGSQVLDFWQRRKEISSVLLQASDSSREGFLGGVVSALSVYSVPRYHATEERLAECLYMLWTVLSEADEVTEVPEAKSFTIGDTTRFQKMLLTKISAQPSLRRLWMPFGGLVGYEALLNLAEESNVVDVVITCLLENGQNMMVDSKESIISYLAQNVHTYSATLANAHAEGRLSVVASLLQCGLLFHPPVTIDVYAKVPQSDVSNLKAAAESFLLDTVLQESNVDRVVPVLAGAGKCIRYLSIPGLRKFSEYALKACQKATEKPESADALRLVAACFPVDDCTAHEASNQRPSDTTKGLAKGTTVWYYHRNENRWENATIVNVDHSAVPPSYSVAIKGGIRETELDRLSVDDPSLSSQSLRFSNCDYSKLVTEEEKSALMDVLKLGLSREDLLGIDVALLAVAYGGRTCRRADWEMVFNFLRRSIESLVEQVCTCLEPIRNTVISQAEKLAQTDFNSLGSAIDFFSLLSRRGILHSSAVNKEAVISILETAGKALNSVARLHGATLSSISILYCHIVATAQTSPFMPIITWESTQAQFCTFVLDVYLLIGKVFAVIILSVPPLESDPWWSSLGESSSVFAQLSEVVRSIIIQADDSFMSNMMKRADGRGVHQVLEGVNGLDAMVAFSMSHSLESLFGTAHVMLFHHPKLLSYLVADANQDGGSQETLQDDALELASKGDVQEAFEAAGMNRVLAVVASNPRHPRFLYAWSLIIGHVLKTTYLGASKAHSGVIACIREMPVIVDKLFSQMLDRLDLSRATSSVKKTKNGGLDASTLPSWFNVSDSFYEAMRDLEVEELFEASGQRPAFAAVLLMGLFRAMPTTCRGWFVRLQDRAMAAALEKYVATVISPGMITAEYTAVEELAQGLASESDSFTVRAVPVSREVVASLKVEEGHSLELIIRFPATFPLKAPEASCHKSVGVGEARLRKWLLSITAFLRNHNGSVAEALSLWKRNADREFSGQEDCLICYSIIQPSNGQLPRLSCRTCRKKFHGACLYKWFHSSGKSNCPHCQSPW